MVGKVVDSMAEFFDDFRTEEGDSLFLTRAVGAVEGVIAELPLVVGKVVDLSEEPNDPGSSSVLFLPAEVIVALLNDGPILGRNSFQEVLPADLVLTGDTNLDIGDPMGGILWCLLMSPGVQSGHDGGMDVGISVHFGQVFVHFLEVLLPHFL